MTHYIKGFSYFVTSMTAPIASGWRNIVGCDSHLLRNTAFAGRKHQTAIRSAGRFGRKHYPAARELAVSCGFGDTVDRERALGGGAVGRKGGLYLLYSNRYSDGT